MKSQTNPKISNSPAIIENLESLFQASDVVLQDGRNQIKKVRFDDSDYVVKSFKRPNYLNRLLYTYLRPSKAKRSYEYSLKIANFVPQAIGFVECSEGGLIAKSYFVSEMYDYDFTIREPLLEANFEQRDNVFKAFAQFSYDLHQQGVLHKDFSPGNILIKKLGEEFEFKIIDINRMNFGELSVEARMRSFKMLWASDAVMDLIIAEYARIAQLDVALCQKLARAFNQRNKRFKNFKKRLKGRPVTD